MSFAYRRWCGRASLLGMDADCRPARHRRHGDQACADVMYGRSKGVLRHAVAGCQVNTIELFPGKNEKKVASFLWWRAHANICDKNCTSCADDLHDGMVMNRL